MSFQARAWLIAVVAFLLLPGMASAADAAPSTPVPLLWKVSDADNSLYLLGSFHVLRAEDYPLSADVDAAFDDAESLLFEIAPAEMASPALALELGQAALRQDGTRLDATLPAATARRLQAWIAAHAQALAAAGIDPESLQRFEAWYVGLTVSMFGMGEAGFDPALGLDRHLGAAAVQAGKPAAGLETGSQQVAFLDAMAADEQVQFLDEALSSALDGDGELGELHALWRAGDADGLWNGMAAEMRRDYPKLYARINVARNDAWQALLESRLAAPGRDDTLVVVGALHLLGSDGLVAKLRADGYVVERICSACE